METQRLINQWFGLCQSGDYNSLPLAPNFSHTSPFGTIRGKDAYLKVISANEDKFLGYSFEILDSMHQGSTACVRYLAKQGENFQLHISEWFYTTEVAIEKIVSYYHIGEIREERRIENYN